MHLIIQCPQYFLCYKLGDTHTRTHAPTHAHTHRQREREREREKHPQICSFSFYSLSAAPTPMYAVTFCHTQQLSTPLEEGILFWSQTLWSCEFL